MSRDDHAPSDDVKRDVRSINVDKVSEALLQRRQLGSVEVRKVTGNLELDSDSVLQLRL
jgi:cyanate lyase